jgi:hypothetical protein
MMYQPIEPTKPPATLKKPIADLRRADAPDDDAARGRLG